MAQVNYGSSGGDVISTLKQKSGTVAAVTFSGSPLRATVTFAAPFADANYSVSLTPRTTANRTFNPKVDDGVTFTANGFSISMSSGNTNNFIACDWVATKHGEN